MLVVHVTASRFFGGPERQMLELAKSLAPDVRSAFVSFAETGFCRPFLARAEWEGELAALLRNRGADVICCHGYKADLLGMLAARRLGIPVIAVSRGWTGETFRVRLYDALDRRVLSSMNKVVCVSAAQAEKVRRADVAASKVVVIRNAIRLERFQRAARSDRSRLQALFPTRPRWIVGAAGRLSPEKGFAFLVDAAAEVLKDMPTTGFVLFGEGDLRESLEQQIAAQQLQGRFILAGFRADFDDYLPHMDLLVLPSLTEGLPNVALEALAAGVPVVATDVGGTGEVVEDGVDGYLVPPGDPGAIAGKISDLLANDWLRRWMGANGRERMWENFSFKAQAAEYRRLFAQLGIAASGVSQDRAHAPGTSQGTSSNPFASTR
jgi:glycosyltransferase involved in cell wall biosynthesis